MLLLCLVPFIALATYALKLRLTYNWGPPEILKQALALPPIDREGIAVILNAQFLVGTDEAALRSTLLKQGFADPPQARASCVKPESNGIDYGPCPAGGRMMTYDYEQFGDIVCGTRHLTIAWSADPAGKVASLKATRYVACL